MKFAAYCRVSTDSEDQLNSLENQIGFFSKYAKDNGHELFKVYADEGISGTRLKKRTQFLKLMDDAKYGLFDTVVVKDVSRFARNTVDFLQSIRALKAMGINTLFLTANMTSLGDSEFILTIFGAIAQEESANLSKRVQWGKHITAEKGRVPQRIFGYDRIDNYTLRINEDEAKIVREIYRMYLEEGMGSRLIAIKLNEMGAKTKFDNDWAPYMVRRILSNSTYCGLYANNKYGVKNFLDGKIIPKDKDEWIYHERPEWAIVSKDTFELAQQQLAQRREQYTHNKVNVGGRYSSKNVFSTLIKCEDCGWSYTRRIHRYKNEYRYWFCPSNQAQTAKHCCNSVKFREEKLLAIIRDYLTGFIADKHKFINDIVADYIKAHPDDTETKRMSPEEIAKQRHALQKRLDKHKEMFVNDLISIEELRQITTDTQRKLDELDSIGQQEKKVEIKLEELEERAKAYYAEVERFLTLENITNMELRKVIDHITVNHDGMVRIYIKKLGE